MNSDLSDACANAPAMRSNGHHWPPPNAGSDGCPVSVASVAARTMGIFPISAR